jgi:hypothetical protein
MENTILCVTTRGGLTTTMTILSAEVSAIKSDDHQAVCSVITLFGELLHWTHYLIYFDLV